MLKINEETFLNTKDIYYLGNELSKWYAYLYNNVKIELTDVTFEEIDDSFQKVSDSLYINVAVVNKCEKLLGIWYVTYDNGIRMSVSEEVAEIVNKYIPAGSGGIQYYQVEFYDDKFYHDGEELDYAKLVEVMNDQTKFLWLSLDNLVYIPNITIDGQNGALAFSTTFVRNDGSQDDPNYQPYISRVIINSENVVGFEEFQLQRADETPSGGGLILVDVLPETGSPNMLYKLPNGDVYTFILATSGEPSKWVKIGPSSGSGSGGGIETVDELPKEPDYTKLYNKDADLYYASVIKPVAPSPDVELQFKTKDIPLDSLQQIADMFIQAGLNPCLCYAGGDVTFDPDNSYENSCQTEIIGTGNMSSFEPLDAYGIKVYEWNTNWVAYYLAKEVPMDMSQDYPDLYDLRGKEINRWYINILDGDGLLPYEESLSAKAPMIVIHEDDYPDYVGPELWAEMITLFEDLGVGITSFDDFKEYTYKDEYTDDDLLPLLEYSGYYFVYGNYESKDGQYGYNYRTTVSYDEDDDTFAALMVTYEYGYDYVYSLKDIPSAGIPAKTWCKITSEGDLEIGSKPEKIIWNSGDIHKSKSNFYYMDSDIQKYGGGVPDKLVFNLFEKPVFEYAKLLKFNDKEPKVIGCIDANEINFRILNPCGFVDEMSLMKIIHDVMHGYTYPPIELSKKEFEKFYTCAGIDATQLPANENAVYSIHLDKKMFIDTSDWSSDDTPKAIGIFVGEYYDWDYEEHKLSPETKKIYVVLTCNVDTDTYKYNWSLEVTTTFPGQDGE